MTSSATVRRIAATLIWASALMGACKLFASDELSIMKDGEGDYTEFSIFGQNFEYTQFYRDWIADHFELSLRYTDYNFKRRFSAGPDDQYFIGSIAAIEAEDPGAGLRNLTLNWFPWAGSSRSSGSRIAGLMRLLEGVGIELGWDELRAKTISPAQGDNPAYSDGTIVAKGPMLSYLIRFENPTRITPYLGMGTIFYSTSVTKGWWHLGFPNEAAYEDWRRAGASGDPTDGWRRTFKVDDDNGWCWFAGATLQIYANWSVDLFYRSTEAEFENTYEISSRGDVSETRNSKWDLSNQTYGIGLRYAF